LNKLHYADQKLVRRQQVAALPFRRTGEGRLEFLLVTSRGSGRWIIPKGWPSRNLPHAESAAKEALEEAGLSGVVAMQPVGTFEYVKRPKDRCSIICLVEVYPLLVQRTLSEWQESGERELRWCTPEEAAGLVTESGLRDIIRAFAARLTN
jgi:8-oxo-dGTP pyrophosphatase MutT (NUDIX family)